VTQVVFFTDQEKDYAIREIAAGQYNYWKEIQQALIFP
jgi:hypothetical protein